MDPASTPGPRATCRMRGPRIPFNRPARVEAEEAYLAEALASGRISGDGAFTGKCREFLKARFSIPEVLLTTSCTHALELAALLLELGPEDEVIIPSFTFVSTANAFVLRGARPVFADVRPDTLNLDEELLEGLITAHTKAIVPVHYAGVGCEMDRIMSLAKHHGIAVIEDNAHGLFGAYKGRPLGTFGALATQSFHETKNFSCGEGGALLINDESYRERAEIIREKGTNRSLFFRGEVDKYTWVDVGSSYLPSDLLAAVLYSQLEAHEAIQGKRLRIWNRYDAFLREFASHREIGLPTIPDHCDHPAHMYYILLPSVEVRQLLIEHLKARGILAVFHYQPLHLSAMGRRFGGSVGDCPVTEDISDRLLRLPLYYGLSEADQDSVLAAIAAFYE